MKHLTPPCRKLRIIWNRITFSRITIIYFCFSLLHFAAQIAIQSTALDTNIAALNELTQVVANIPVLSKGLPIMHGSVLEVCTWVPSNLQTEGGTCTVIWNGAVQATGSVAKTTLRNSTQARETAFLTGKLAIDFQSLQNSSDAARLTTKLPDATCQASLVWPISVLKDKKREDFTFLAFQLWVLGMSIVALLNESIPHIFASMLTHMMSTGWAVFQITDTSSFRSAFQRVIVQGTCKGTPVLSTAYWTARAEAELAGVVLDVVALLVSSYLTWRMTKLFGWQTFKRIGASLVISHIYRLVLLLSIAIQLCFFFVMVTVSLWIDQLVNRPIGDLAHFRALYLTGSSIALVFLLPWLILGWVGVRLELKVPIVLFLLLELLYIGCFGLMLVSTTFRWTFVTWPFFSVMASASFFLTCIALILGLICRCNFGKGLLRYLNPVESADDTKLFHSSDVEKLNFPSHNLAVPTYSSQFQFVNNWKPTSQTQITKIPIIVALPPRYDSLRHPPLVHEHKKNLSHLPLLGSEASISRSVSGSSNSSSSSHYNIDGGNRNKRWVIE